MRDLQTLDAVESAGPGCSGDGADAPGELRARACVGVPAADGDLRAARAGKRRSSSDESELARIVRTVWLTVATGGWWTVKDVRDARPTIDGRQVAARLSVMVKRGLVVSRELPQGKRARRKGVPGAPPRHEYSVTPECRVPAGLTAGEVSRALIG